METKLIEIRDAATMIPAVAVKVTAGNKKEAYLIGRAAMHDRDYIFLFRMDSSPTEWDPNRWKDKRTMMTVHQYLYANWKKIKPGWVVDVEFILGETKVVKKPERLWKPKRR